MSNFWTRVCSGAILIAVFGLGFVSGGIVLAAIVTFFSMVGLFEYYQAIGIWKTSLSRIGMAGAAAFLLVVFLGLDSWLFCALLYCISFLFVFYAFTFPRYTISRVAEAAFGIFYIPVMMSYIYRIRELQEGAYLVWIIFLASWGSDAMAYLCGKLFGKHPLAPELSPKKTVEGSVGGVLGAAVLGALYGLVFAPHLELFDTPCLSLAAVCAVGGVISEIGDLTASAIKRNTGIKDFGSFIPGHGGVMDRFDSVVAMAPVMFYLVVLLSSESI